MKLNELKKVIKQSVKEAIQEEMKTILLEAVRTPQQPIVENRTDAPVNYAPTATAETPKLDRAQIRENYMNVLGDMAAGKTVTTSNIGKPLQVTSADTTSPNGSLPEGEVGMGQIMNLMNGKV
jgi:hypothetical protein